MVLQRPAGETQALPVTSLGLQLMLYVLRTCMYMYVQYRPEYGAGRWYVCPVRRYCGSTDSVGTVCTVRRMTLKVLADAKKDANFLNYPIKIHLFIYITKITDVDHLINVTYAVVAVITINKASFISEISDTTILRIVRTYNFIFSILSIFVTFV
jgi:hypothetical protein